MCEGMRQWCVHTVQCLPVYAERIVDSVFGECGLSNIEVIVVICTKRYFVTQELRLVPVW